MATLVFVEMPASGHVNPSLPIARELVRRGERVVYYTDAEFQAAVERTGAAFRPYPAGVLTSRILAEATQTGDLTRVPTAIIRATESLLPYRPNPNIHAMKCKLGRQNSASSTLKLPLQASVAI